jgi:hypothetical protein
MMKDGESGGALRLNHFTLFSFTGTGPVSSGICVYGSLKVWEMMI